MTSERGYCRIISVGRIDRMSEANEVDEELLVLSAISYIIDLMWISSGVKFCSKINFLLVFLFLELVFTIASHLVPMSNGNHECHLRSIFVVNEVNQWPLSDVIQFSK